MTDTAKPVILIVIDGLTPTMLEATDTPMLRFLLDHGTYRRSVSTFPSLTPVCLSTIATGAGPDRTRIPALQWYHRGEQRFVEYGSSFQATLVEGDGVDPLEPRPPRRLRHLHAHRFGTAAGGLLREEYLEFGYVTDDRTIYKGARKVPAAHIVEWSDGRISQREYWTPASARSTFALSSGLFQ